MNALSARKRMFSESASEPSESSLSKIESGESYVINAGIKQQIHQDPMPEVQERADHVRQGLIASQLPCLPEAIGRANRRQGAREGEDIGSAGVTVLLGQSSSSFFFYSFATIVNLVVVPPKVGS